MAPAPRIGTEFAGYRIEGLLGRGGMGVVYRAEHPRLGATIALKVMDPELASDEAFRERFVREARAAARIKHPSIVPIYDAGEWQGDLYLAMRYVEGDDLRSMLHKGGPLPLEQTCIIGMQIASALDAAHRSGLIHRDVKPGNVLVEPGPDPDSPPVAYVADLGLTKLVDSAGGASGSGELLGTIDYIAPEQISGSHIDGRADIYSLACVLFECLTGTVPYVRENQAAVLWAHLHDEVPRATTFNSSLPKAVDAALARGLAKAPEDRFSTGKELVEALRTPSGAATAITRGGAESEPPPSFRPEPAARPRSSRRALAVAAAVGVVLGAAGAAAGAFFLLDDGKPASRTPTADSPAAETTPAPRAASLTAFDKELLPHVPDEYRRACRHARPLSDDFDATLSCSPGGAVSSLTYSHARSGFLLFDHLLRRVTEAGLPASNPLTLAGFCGTGDIPSANSTISDGLSGRTEVAESLKREERLGFVLCDQRGGRARIEWTTSEIGVYAIAKGEELGSLYEWWRRDAGPEP
jgi:hypothetical protein